MIKGCKHYFSMFGMLIQSINTTLQKFFNTITQQIKKSIYIKIDYKHTQSKYIFQKNQTYQG